MAMKKKKTEKRTGSKPGEKSLSGTIMVKGSDPENVNLVIAGFGRSFYTLLDRTKAYLGSGKKAET
jgi:hypothetical protein